MSHALRSLLLLSLLALLIPAALQAQRGRFTVSPPELYSGDNEITVTAEAGIRSISVSASGSITSVSGDGPGSCEKSRTLKVYVNTASEAISLNITTVDCKGRTNNASLYLSTVWTLDHNNLGTVVEGESACFDFSVRSPGSNTILDNITVDDPRLSLRLPRRLPLDITNSYYYKVCFKSDTPGVYTFPVVTWIRRRYPSAGQTTYAVADTGVIVVVPKKPPVDTTTPPDTVIPVDTTIYQIVDSTDPGIIEMFDPPVTDPTTFRSIAVPNAVIPPKGKLYLGSYDVIGLTGGYSLDDHLMIIAGGAPPFPDDWSGTHGTAFGAWSAGLKIGLRLDEFLGSSVPIALAGGFQHAESFFDEETTVEPDSKIRLNVPYAALSVGDDDRRVSVTGGYAFKHHQTRVIYEGTTIVGIESYTRNAAFVAVGGDWRIGRNWKLTAEALTMETVGVVPVLAGVRYFTNRWAIDGAVAYVGIVSEGTARPKIPLAPVISFIGVF